MEASQSGILINNTNTITVTTNLAITLAIGLVSGGGVAGILLTIIGKFGSGFIDEFFLKRSEAKKQKKEAAKDINSFVIEGMHRGFLWRPGSAHHILFRAQEIEAIDPEAGKKLRQFLNCWQQYRDFLKRGRGAEKMAIDFRNDAQNFGEELLEIARKWSK